MFGKGTKIYSIFKLKCPRCHEGELFTHSNPYNFSKMDKMPDRCPVCRLNYMPEPAFYYGAMYVSYALSVALSVATFVAIYFFVDLEPLYYILINAAVLVLLFPLIFRVSRSLWINFFISYKEDWAKSDKTGGTKEV